MRDTVVKQFQYFYSKVSGHMNYRFNPTIAESKMISSFIEMLPSKTESFLFQYLCYQFHYWHDKETRFGKGKIQLNWVVGKKAMERWSSSKEGHWYSYSTDLMQKFGITRSDLISDSASVVSDRIAEYEENDKMRYHNTDEGLLFCMDYTSMWHPKSSSCNSCNSVSVCKNVMSVKYSTVYNNRIKCR